jgi:hypothetical protein
MQQNEVEREQRHALGQQTQLLFLLDLLTKKHQRLDRLLEEMSTEKY